MAIPLLDKINISAYYPILLIFLCVIFFAGVVLAMIFLFMRWVRYKQYKVEIWEFNDEGHLINIKKDQAGIFYDATTKMKLLYVMKAKVGISPDKIPYFWEGNRKKMFLVRLGEKNYHFINPKVKYDKLSLSVGEEDVNWAVDDYNRGIAMFSNPDRLMQLLPYIIWALVIIGSLILVIQILKKADVIRDVMVLAQQIAAQNVQAATGTTVTPGGVV